VLLVFTVAARITAVAGVTSIAIVDCIALLNATRRKDRIAFVKQVAERSRYAVGGHIQPVKGAQA